jgi:hypothetical protein
LRAAADAEIEVSRTDDLRVATVTKQKDGSDGAKYPFRLAVVPIGEDEDGDTIDSCVVEHVEAMPRRQGAPKGKWQSRVWDALNNAIGIGEGEDVAVDDLIGATVASEPEELRPPRMRALVKQAIAGLREGGFVQVEGGRVRPIAANA